jgi:hypothetical protein
VTVASITDFSVKEKDEASLSDGFRRDLQDAFILHLRGLKVFYFQTSRWSLNRKPILRKISEKTIEGSALEKTRFLFVRRPVCPASAALCLGHQ